MLYLEDYLEMIEHLPQELRDRFTEMREMDLSVQNSMDNLEKRSRTFFIHCKRNDMHASTAEHEFKVLRKDYYKVLEDADEKVTLSTQMHELVERYLRRLDSELFKFKCELEADNNGITEILEKRSLELDGTGAAINILHQKENRYFGTISTNVSSNTSSSQKERYRHKPEKRRESSNCTGAPPEKRQHMSSNHNILPITQIAMPIRPKTPNHHHNHHPLLTSSTNPPVSFTLQSLGAGNAIAAAASQAIVATQQMQQGRRTASLKASYEAINHGTVGSGSHELVIGKELVGATHNAIQAVEREGGHIHGHGGHSSSHSHGSHGHSSSHGHGHNHSHSHGGHSSSHGHGSSHSHRRHKKKSSSSHSHISSSTSIPSLPLSSSSSTVSHSSSVNVTGMEAMASRINDNGLIVEQTQDGEWSYDPNEPRYCICNQVSYGDMVACDNEACPFEWFHYPCVGITQSPKGKWYCPKCIASMRRRGNRKN